MKRLKLKYILPAIVAVAIIILAGGYQLPKYTGRLIFVAILAVIDILYWATIHKSVSRRFYKFLKVAYWIPMAFLLVFFIAGLISPYTQWPLYLSIYIPALLMVLLIGKGIFLAVAITGEVLMFPVSLYRKLVSYQRTRPFKWFRPGFILTFSTILSGLVMLIFISGMIFWVNNFKLTTVVVPVKELPREFDGYRIIQLSDLHLGSMVSSGPLEKIIEIVNAQHPDLILFTGDMVNFTTAEALPFEKEMKQFSARDGAYSILGNHDYGEYSQWDSPEAKVLNDTALFRFYDRIGWHLLRNQNKIIRRDSSTISVIGVENWSMNKRFGKKGDLKKALAGTEQSNYKILMSHDPTHWDGEVNRLFPQIGLTLSGHTHAFQIAIEKGNINWSPASLLFKQWGGLFEKKHANGEKQFLYVNRGAGTLGYPGRIGTRPEITLIILRKAE